MELEREDWEGIVDHPSSKEKARLIAVLTHIAGVVVFLGLLLLIVDSPWTAVIGGIILWITLYLSTGIREFKQQEFAGVERFGQFLGIRTAGLTVLLLPGIIDKVLGPYSLKYQGMDIYTEEDDGIKPAIDFPDITAKVKAVVNYSITRLAKGERDPTYRPARDMLRFLYIQDEPILRLKEVSDKFLRGYLEDDTHDEFQRKRKDVQSKVLDEESVVKALAEMGIYLNEEKPIVLQDIILPESAERLRERRLEAQTSAEFDEKRGEGYGRAFRAIIRQAKEEDPESDITIDEARQIFEFQAGLQSLKEYPGSINFLGNSITDLLTTIRGGR